MDIHLTSDAANARERSAIDELLGAPVSNWSDGSREVVDRIAVQVGNHRHILLPAFHAIHASCGWLSPGALNYLATRLQVPPAEVHSVATFYELFSLEPQPAVVMHVCDDIACQAKGADELCNALERKLGPSGEPVLGENAVWKRSSCLGLCERAPAVFCTRSGDAPQETVAAPVTAESAIAHLKTLTEGGAASSMAIDASHLSIPQAGAKGLSLLCRAAASIPPTLDAYLQSEGFSGLKRAFAIGPERTVQEVLDSKLLGRGGAGFPTGKKWEALLKQRKTGSVHYVVCNADESEPGTFKDRYLMERDPFAVLEGMIIAGFAVGAQTGFLYVRGEYPLAHARLADAIRACRERNFLGQNIQGTEFCYDIDLRRGGGAYICGEETALFNSIEGFRGEPRTKPPFPTESGLFRKPTVPNNVETLANVPIILREGGAAFAKTGTAQSTGTRLFCLSGYVVRPGIYEVPFGTTAREIITLAGGVGGTGKLKAVLLGGAAGGFIAPNELDVPLTFEGTRAIGASLGSGVVMLFDDSTDLEKVLLRIAEFFRHESCGQCVPCRIGTIRQREIVHRLQKKEAGKVLQQDLTLLNDVSQVMRDASICALGQTASSALQSALQRWELFK